MDKDRSTILLLKKITDGLTEDEQIEYQQWLNAGRKEFVNALLSEDISQDLIEFQRIDISRGLNRVLKHVRHRRIIFLSFRAVIAACILAVTCLLVFHPYRQTINPHSIIAEVFLDTIAKAQYPTITLSDYRQYNLDSLRDTALLEQLGLRIDFTGDHEIRYVVPQHFSKTYDKTLYNIIQVPFGRPWKVVMTDSSILWINGGSIVQLPFIYGNEKVTREVFLRGESFFDVVPLELDGAAVPFVVKVGNNMEVRVTGTRFNVRGFKEDSAIFATLVRGKIKVVSNGLAASPKAGQAVVVNRTSGKMKLEKVDTALTSSWMSGKIVLGGTGLEGAISRIASAYGYEVVFIDRIGEETQTIVGRLDMTMSVDQAKKFINNTIGAKIEEKGRTWYVSENVKR